MWSHKSKPLSLGMQMVSCKMYWILRFFSRYIRHRIMLNFQMFPGWQNEIRKRSKCDFFPINQNYPCENKSTERHTSINGCFVSSSVFGQSIWFSQEFILITIDRTNFVFTKVQSRKIHSVEKYKNNKWKKSRIKMFTHASTTEMRWEKTKSYIIA